MSTTLQAVATEGWWGGGSVITPPTAVTIPSADGIAPTTIRVNFNWVAGATHIYIERATAPLGSFTQVGDCISENYYDDTVLTGAIWYYRARGYNAGGYGPYGDVVEGIARTSNQIEQALWASFKAKMQADSYLHGYIVKWKFDREESILPSTIFPILKAWIASTREVWIAVPKRKIVVPRVIIHGIVKVMSSSDLETEKLKMDEYIKNAIEADVTFAGDVTMNIVGDTIFNNLDDSTAEIFVECEIMSKIFIIGQR